MDIHVLSSVAFPVVVIEGRMFECYLDTVGEVQMSETTSGHVLVPTRHRTHLGGTSPYDSVVRVVTESAVESLAAQSRKAIDVLLAEEDAIRELSQYESSRFRAEGGADEIPF